MNREKLEVYEQELSFLFEAIAYRLIDCPLTFDGVTISVSKIRKSRQIVFEGEMWVLRNSNENKEWFEPFGAIVTDKRITKQGIWIKIWVGDYSGEAELLRKFQEWCD